MSTENDTDDKKGKDEEKNTIGDGEKREPIKPEGGDGGFLTDKILETVNKDKGDEDKDDDK